MRIRLVHTQSLLLIASVLLTVLCMGGLNAWNLRHGFSEFLAARDVERLEQFAMLVSQNAEQAGSIEGLKAKGLGIHDLFRQFGLTQGKRQDNIFAQQDMSAANSDGFKPAPRHPPDANNDTFKSRVSIYTTDGQPLLGKKQPSDAGLYTERPVRIRGETVATVRMINLKPVPDDVEKRFLTSQYVSIIFGAAILLMVALVSAYWAVGYWVKPLLQIESATERIALGEFDARLDDTRTDEIGDTMRNINRMAMSLQRLEGSRRRWMADMSHELRTPLTVLRGEIDALIDGVTPLKPQTIISLQEEVLQLNALVDDLHLLAMSDLKELPCYFEEFDLVKLVEKITQRFTPRATRLGLKLDLNVTFDTEKSVYGDAKRIEQLISNLIDNSLRYTDAPGSVAIQLETTDNHIAIVIEDSLPAVSTKELQFIFDPLFRADAARQRSRAGSGLGLAICSAIVQAHKGSIHSDMSDLGGLRIQVLLPRDIKSS